MIDYVRLLQDAHGIESNRPTSLLPSATRRPRSNAYYKSLNCRRASFDACVAYLVRGFDEPWNNGQRCAEIAFRNCGVLASCPLRLDSGLCDCHFAASG
jgi:hypothetical protein